VQSIRDEFMEAAYSVKITRPTMQDAECIHWPRSAARGGGVGHDFHATQKLCRMGMYMAQRGS
jgi:hypothetical protein